MSRLQRTTATYPLIRGVRDIEPGHSSVEFVARHLFWGVRFTEFRGPLWYASRRRDARPSARALGTGPAQEVV